MGNSGKIINGRYQILHELGEGGFGKTYLAKDTERPSHPRCVIKHLQPRFNNPSLFKSAKERFVKEAHSLEHLGVHSQIPQLFAYIEENQEFYLVQEWVDGEEIRREVSRGVFDEAKAINFLKEALEVLSFVHQQGVIHRDIKPSNLLRRRSDQKVILIDFGAVKEIETFTYQGENPSIYTQAIGTPGYMSPEQQYGQPVFSSDIYALGRTVIFTLTGRSPIELEDTQTGDLNNWQQFVSISPIFKAILSKMIHPRPNERYSSVDQVLQEVKPLTKIGQVIGEKYRIEEFLGGKEESYTYLAENITLSGSKSCILRQLTLSSEEKEGKTLILRELRVLEKLGDYERIPKLLDHFEIDKTFYLVQEYIEGQSLKEILAQGTCLTENQVIHLLKEGLTILDFIHRHQVIHRDIKPSNLIRQFSNDHSYEHRYFLVDFADIKESLRVLGSKIKSSYLSKDVGTEGYRSPEKMAGCPVFASDIYSLGITAIEALTGQSPQQLNSHPKTGLLLWSTDLNYNQKLVKILEKMTKIDLDERYKTAQDVLKDLRKLDKSAHLFPFSSTPRWSLFAFLSGILVTIGGLLFYGIILYQTDFLLRKGDLENKNKNYEAAIRYYDNALENAPIFASSILNFEKAFIQKALAYSGLGKPEKMLKTCEAAINFNPQSPYAWNCKGAALEALGRKQEAIQAYNYAIQKAPNSFEAWHNRGLLYSQLKNEVQAEADFKQAIELNPKTSYVSWNDLGKLYYNFEDYPQAITAYQEAVKLNPDYSPSWIGLGNTYSKLKEYQAAIQAYDRAIAINPQADEAWYSKGLAAEALKRYEDAYDFYDQARVINPKNTNYRHAQQRLREKL